MFIDAGNSRVKWASYDTQTTKLGVITAESYSIHKGNNKYLTVNQLLEREKPARVILVHVLGANFEQAILSQCHQLQIKCQFVTSSITCCGVTNGYDIAENFGADRFVALIAAHHLFPQENVIVIDAGTAVTIDMVDSKGLHLGGVILPGLQLWIDTLIKNTQLQHTSVIEMPDVFAKNTQMGIDSGRLMGLSGAILHVCNVMEKTMDQSIKRIFCGGDSRLLAEYYQQIHQWKSSKNNNILIPDLVINGLQVIEELENDKGK